MAAALGRNQRDLFVTGQRWIRKTGERNEGIVLRGQNQRGNLYVGSDRNALDRS